MKLYTKNATNLKENEELRIEVYKLDGSMNYISGTTNKKGIYIGFQPVVLKDEGNYISEKYELFGDKRAFKICIKEMKRHNKKDLIRICNNVKLKLDDIVSWYNNDTNILIDKCKELY